LDWVSHAAGYNMQDAGLLSIWGKANVRT
jgi:hypothetical protein